MSTIDFALSSVDVRLRSLRHHGRLAELSSILRYDVSDCVAPSTEQGLTVIPGRGKLVAKAWTSFARASSCRLPSPSPSVATRKKSLRSFEPASFCNVSEICTARWRNSATLTISGSFMLREVSAEVPIRTPPGTCAEVSPVTAFCCSISAIYSIPDVEG